MSITRTIRKLLFNGGKQQASSISQEKKTSKEKIKICQVTFNLDFKWSDETKEI